MRVVILAAAAMQIAAAARDPMAVEIRRGFVAAGSKTSEQPALREERDRREPSQGFMIGVALGAWSNAAAQLQYALEVPSGDGDDTAAIDLDCQEEGTAFKDLQARSQAAGLAAAQLVAAGQAEDAGALARLQLREAGPLPRCR